MPTSTQAAVSVLIGADLGRSFRDSFTTANKQVTALGDALKKTNDKAAQLDSFRQSSRTTKEASLAYHEAKQKLNLLSAEIARTDKPSKELENNFRRARVAADQAKSAFMDSARATREMGKVLTASGINFKTFNAQQQALSKTAVILGNRQTALQNNADAKAANLSRRANYRAQMFDAVALGSALYATVKPAVDFEFAMAQVGAVTEEAADSEGFKKLTAQARELGRTTQYSATQAAEAMRYLGMTGFSTNQILAATPAILNMAIADNMELGESAEIVSNILNAFAMEASRATEAADVLAQASIATSTDIKLIGETMKYVAPAAAAVGGSLQETTALAGVLANNGIKASMAGTMLRSAYLRLAAPAKKGAEALGQWGKELKISAEEMPDVAKEALVVQRRLGNLKIKIFDDRGKMRSIITILKELHEATKNLSDAEKIATAKDIYGTYATVGSLAIAKGFDSGMVDQVLDKINHADGISAKIARRLRETAAGSLRILRNSIVSVGIDIGTTLLPTLTSLAVHAASFANGISSLAIQFPVLTKYIGFAVAGMIGFKIAAVALGYAFTFLRGVVLAVQGSVVAFRAALTLLGVVMPAVTLGIRAMGLALLMNPITWIVAGIVAGVTVLAVAAGLLIKNWTPIGEFFKNIFSGIIGWVQKAYGWICKFITPLKVVVDTATNLAGKAWNFLAEDGIGTLGSTGSSIGKSFTNLASNLASDLGNAFESIFGSVDNETKSSETIKSSSYTTSQNNNTQITVTINNNGSSASNLDERKIADQVKTAIDETLRKFAARKYALNYDNCI